MSTLLTAPHGPDIVERRRPDGSFDFTQRWTKFPPPPSDPDDSEVFIAGGTKPNAGFLRRHLHREGRLREYQALRILQDAAQLMQDEPNLIYIQSPVTIVGDIHGQYYDLVRLMEPTLGGSPSKTRYLFLGDYVDRGVFGIECILLLFALKINYPGNFTLLRGNHECRRLTDFFTFRLECRRKYSDRVYDAAIEAFNALPLAAVVDNTLFCVHGGISPHLETLEDILALDRFQEPPTRGLMCDLLWSDPARDHSHDAVEFAENPQRGCSYFYGYKAVRNFLDKNNFSVMIRAHEVEESGFRRYASSGQRPHLMTLFSAPNYLDFYGNLGAIMVYENAKMSVRQFTGMDHPYWLPNFSDAFTWSLPFVALKAADMLRTIMDVMADEEDEDEDMEVEVVEPRPQLYEEIRGLFPSNEQVINVDSSMSKRIKKNTGRMTKVYTLLREEVEDATELRGDGVEVVDRAEIGRILRAGSPHVRPGTPFDEVRRMDLINERLPNQFIDITQARAYNGPYSSSQPHSYGHTVHDEPEEYEEPPIHNRHLAFPQHRGNIGTTSTSPSTRRRTLEEMDELLRDISAKMVLRGA